MANEIETSSSSKYRVLRPLNHSHKLYPVDGEVNLSATEAEPLIAHQVVKPATREVPVK